MIGHPVAHSRSPAMQNAALRELGLADEWSYDAIEIPPADFEPLTRALPGEGFVGANVTIPHKQAALALADSASAAATEIGAANTLSFAGGEIRAENTDAPGLLAALGKHPSGKRSLVLGAGGSARAAAWALAGQGAMVEVWNRTGDRADELIRDLGRTFAASGEMPDMTAVSSAQARAAGYELIVNCTAVGLDPGDDPLDVLPLRSAQLGKGVTVVDLVYGGEPTRLARIADEAGASLVDGVEVLVRQGAASLRIWTGEDAPLAAMRKAARRG
ncbi:MAG: shikimate dehydrogenase [Solirubrobacterales bacterium]